MSSRNAVIENASNGQTPFLERRWLVGLLIPRLAIYYGLLKLECRSWNVADQNAFINAKRLSGARAQRYCGARQTKRRSPFTIFPQFDVIMVMQFFHDSYCKEKILFMGTAQCVCSMCVRVCVVCVCM